MDFLDCFLIVQRDQRPKGVVYDFSVCDFFARMWGCRVLKAENKSANRSLADVSEEEESRSNAPFGIWILVECFHSCGTLPVARVLSNSCWSTPPSCPAQCFSVWPQFYFFNSFCTM